MERTIGIRERSKKNTFEAIPWSDGQACTPEVVVGKKAGEKI